MKTINEITHDDICTIARAQLACVHSMTDAEGISEAIDTSDSGYDFMRSALRLAHVLTIAAYDFDDDGVGEWHRLLDINSDEFVLRQYAEGGIDDAVMALIVEMYGQDAIDAF